MNVSQLNTNVNLLDIARRTAEKVQSESAARTNEVKSTFSEELSRARDVNFSDHAKKRLFSRGIEMSNEKLDQLSGAIDKAAGKGSKNTLILDSDAAYVASVSNRTIISAFSRDNLQEGIFTSIDSAVIL